MLRWFKYDHLPLDKQAVSQLFSVLAHQIDDTIPPGPERTAGLRKLLEAKDCIVRAHMEGQPAPAPVKLSHRYKFSTKRPNIIGMPGTILLDIYARATKRADDWLLVFDSPTVDSIVGPTLDDVLVKARALFGFEVPLPDA